MQSNEFGDLTFNNLVPPPPPPPSCQKVSTPSTQEKQVSTPPHFFNPFMMSQNFHDPNNLLPYEMVLAMIPSPEEEDEVDDSTELERLPPKEREKVKYRKRSRTSSDASEDLDIQPKKKKRKTKSSYESGKEILFEYFLVNILNPYPKRSEKEDLSRRSGLKMGQVNDFFTNFRKRYWLPAKKVLGGEKRGKKKIMKKLQRSKQGKIVYETLQKVFKKK